MTGNSIQKDADCMGPRVGDSAAPTGPLGDAGLGVPLSSSHCWQRHVHAGGGLCQPELKLGDLLSIGAFLLSPLVKGS